MPSSWDNIAYVPGSILTTPRQLVAACCLRATTPVHANETKRPSTFHRRSHGHSFGARQVSAWKEIVAYPPQMATPAVMLGVGRQTALLSWPSRPTGRVRLPGRRPQHKGGHEGGRHLPWCDVAN